MNFSLEPPPGFQGLRDDLPVTRYRRSLPHLRQDGATYFVTFRLNDSLPKQALQDLQQIREEWVRKHPPPNTETELTEKSRLLSTREEYWLDQGHGECPLRKATLRKPLQQALLRMKEKSGSLYACVVMPNHVHALVHPRQPDLFPLETILKNCKGASSFEINTLRNSTGTIWRSESFDRIVRDAEHLYRCVQYIGRNPTKAKLPESHYARWVLSDWEALGWGFQAK